MIHIRTPSRLHFGLLSLEAEGRMWPNRQGEPLVAARAFGGVGLLIQEPGLELRVSLAEQWSAEGPLAERALRMAQRFTDAMRQQGAGTVSPCHLEILSAPPEHVGLGTGTQLGMAVAHGLARLWRLSLDLPTLARAVGRGQRSALGVHGFVQGGFLVEAGKSGMQTLSPLVARVELPEAWRIVLVIPACGQGCHGMQEKQAFASLAARGGLLTSTDALCRLVLLGLLPALQAADCDLFGEVLHDFNQRVGETFAGVQEGIYATRETAAVVAFVRGQGVKGTGQSSWGPTVFAVVPDPERASDLARRVGEHFGASFAHLSITRPANRGAVIEEGG
jgi:beta-ribofuranosylaminobenzene 5'-phosphate synthase